MTEFISHCNIICLITVHCQSNYALSSNYFAFLVILDLLSWDSSNFKADRQVCLLFRCRCLTSIAIGLSKWIVGELCQAFNCGSWQLSVWCSPLLSVTHRSQADNFSNLCFPLPATRFPYSEYPAAHWWVVPTAILLLQHSVAQPSVWFSPVQSDSVGRDVSHHP